MVAKRFQQTAERERLPVGDCIFARAERESVRYLYDVAHSQYKTEGGAAIGKGLFSSIKFNEGDTIYAFKGEVIYYKR